MNYTLVISGKTASIENPSEEDIKTALEHARNCSVSVLSDRRNFMRAEFSGDCVISIEYAVGEQVFRHVPLINGTGIELAEDMLISYYRGKKRFDVEWEPSRNHPTVIKPDSSKRPQSGFEVTYDFRGEYITYLSPVCYAIIDATFPGPLIIYWDRNKLRSWSGQPLDDEQCYTTATQNILDYVLRQAGTVLVYVKDRESDQVDPFLQKSIAERQAAGSPIALFDEFDCYHIVSDELARKQRAQHMSHNPLKDDSELPFPHLKDSETWTRDVTLKSLRALLKQSMSRDDGFVICSRAPLEFMQAAWNEDLGWHVECRDKTVFHELRSNLEDLDSVARLMRDFVTRSPWYDETEWTRETLQTDEKPMPAANAIDTLLAYHEINKVLSKELLSRTDTTAVFGLSKMAWNLIIGICAICVLAGAGILYHYFSTGAQPAKWIPVMCFIIIVLLGMVVMVAVSPLRLRIDCASRISQIYTQRNTLISEASFDDLKLVAVAGYTLNTQSKYNVHSVETWNLMLRGPETPCPRKPFVWPLLVTAEQREDVIKMLKDIAESLGIEYAIEENKVGASTR